MEGVKKENHPKKRLLTARVFRHNLGDLFNVPHEYRGLDHLTC